jgi:arylsulfatase A-like enzyme
MLAGYYAHCSALDECVGDLLRTLRENGLEKNTIIVFTADHGDLLGSHGGRNKQQPFDESVRVPFLVHWPALGEGKKVDAPIASPDVMPTLLGLCGVTIPKSVEGTDFSDYLRGGKNPSDNAALISCAAPFGQWSRKNGGREYRGIRTLHHTYVRDLNGPWLLFDNDVDPFQMKNLAGDPGHAKLQSELDTLLQRKLREAHDEFLPAENYIRKWGYKVDATGTVPYTQ